MALEVGSSVECTIKSGSDVSAQFWGVVKGVETEGAVRVLPRMAKDSPANIWTLQVGQVRLSEGPVGTA